jgi:sigma-B regulation protein RsbU (phosphoserine phosphatase)
MQSLTLCNVPESLTELAAWVAWLGDHYQLPQPVGFRLDLVLTEAVTNIIDYGYPDARPGWIEIVCHLRETAVDIELCDDGQPFDPTARAPAELPATLEQATPGGLGIHLMRSYASSMTYRRADGLNHLSLSLPHAHAVDRK